MPLTGREPLQAPEAAHDVALVELHVSTDAPPGITADGFAVRVAVGTATLTEAVATGLVPLGPLQVNENEEFLRRAPVL